jgi:hypothetical protein
MSYAMPSGGAKEGIRIDHPQDLANRMRGLAGAGIGGRNGGIGPDGHASPFSFEVNSSPHALPLLCILSYSRLSGAPP